MSGISLDLTPMLDFAISIVNGVGGVLLLVAGIPLGFGIIKTVIDEVRRAL